MGNAVNDSLVPDLAQWNDGAGIALDEWIYIVGRADHALGYQAAFWPGFELLDGYVLRAPVDRKRLEDWERSGAGRKQVETAMNAFFLDTIFPGDRTEDTLKNRQIDAIAATMRDMLATKLTADFPGRDFAVFILDDDDFGVSFHQI